MDKGMDKAAAAGLSSSRGIRRNPLSCKWCPGWESNPHALAGRGF